MSFNSYRCGCSALALALAAGLVASTAQAQSNRPSDDDDSSVSEVVVTGSLLAGTPTDSALPVNVVTVQDLKKTGSPNNVELIKRLSEVGSVQGDNNRYSGLPQGAGSINFRGLQSSRSLVVMNGRRFPNQPGSFIGRFQNTNLIPTFAIGRIELLKQGGAVTYGADGVGGVANFITQKAYDGVEVGASVRHVRDADGPDYDAYVNGGKVWDRGDIFVSLGYQHRDDMKATTRDFIDRDYLENPDGLAWTANGNPGAYNVQLPSGAAFATITPGGVGPLRYVGDRQMSGTGVIRDKYCGALGGFNGWSATPSPVCLWHLSETDYLAEHQETYQAFVAGNFNITDKIKLHTEVMYSKYELPDVVMTPLNEGPASGPAGGAETFTTLGTNPAVLQFLNDYNNVLPGNAALRATAFTAEQIAAVTNPAAPGRIGLPNSVWRLYAQGGLPASLGGSPDGSDQSERVSNEMFRITNSLKGELGTFLGVEWAWDVGYTYSFSKYRIEMTDVLIQRMQLGLDGFASAKGAAVQCNPAIAANRGNAAAGCYYINPFSSAVPGNPTLGLTNPGFVSTGTYAGYMPGMGLQNNPDVIRWLQEPIYIQRTQDFQVVDALLTGEGGFTLPGGPISFAVGAQYRLTKERLKMGERQIISYPDPADPLNRTIWANPCPNPTANPATPTSYPNAPAAGAFTGCPVAVGLYMSGPSGNRTQAPGQSVAGPERRRFPVHSAFFEVNLPIFDSLHVNLAGRYEKFFSDQIGGKDNTVFVPAMSAKWRVSDHLAFRLGYGQSFTQVDPPRASVFNSTTALNGIQPAAALRSISNTEIRPETSEYYNVGAIVQIGAFQGMIDYWSIQVNDYTVRTVTSGLLLTGLTDVRGAIGNATINCSSPLLTQNQPFLTNAQGASVPFFQLAPGATCVQGTTRVADIRQVTLRPGYNSGSLTTNGVDIALNYTFDDVYGGTLGLRADATLNLSYKLSAFEIGGVEIAPEYEGIGTRNSNIGGNGQLIPRWRGGFSVNYNHGRHNLNLATRYMGPIIDDRNLSTFAPGILALNANPGDAAGSSIPCASTLIVPANAGTANNGGAFVNGAPVLQPSPTGATTAAGSVGFQASCTQQVLTGRKMEGSVVSDLTYSVELPWQARMTLSVFNLFDSDPPFSRDALSYNHYFNSPLGRNYKIAFIKRF